MKITENFKSKLRTAKKDGFQQVYVVAGSYKATTYIDTWGIDELLEIPSGVMLSALRQGRWTDRYNTRDLKKDGIKSIMYSQVFKKF